MKQLAKDIKKGDKILLAGNEGIVEEVEISDLGKQGTKKVRLIVSTKDGKITVIRPDNYPIEKK